MATIKTKGNDVATLRKMIARLGGSAEASFLASLTPEARAVFLQATPQQWIVLEHETEILKQAAVLLFPGEAGALRRLAREVAGQSLNSGYQIFLKISSRAFLVKQVARLWNFFYSQGKAEVIAWDGLQGRLSVREFSECDAEHREYFAGVLEALLDPQATQGVRVEPAAEQTSEAWQWRITFKHL